MTKVTYQIGDITIRAWLCPDGGHCSVLVIDGQERSQAIFDRDGREEAHLYVDKPYNSDYERDLTADEIAALKEVAKQYPWGAPETRSEWADGYLAPEPDLEAACEAGLFGGAMPADI